MLMAEHVYPWLERYFDCWSGGSWWWSSRRRRGGSSGRLHCEHLAGDYGVRERWREEGEKKGGRGYGCALIQPAGAISPTPSGEPKGDHDPRGK